MAAYGSFVFLVLKSAYRVPFHDHYTYLRDLFVGASTLHWLFERVGDMRFVVPKGLILLDLWMLGGDLRLITAAGLLAHAAAIVLLWSAIGLWRPRAGAARWLVGALVTMWVSRTFYLEGFVTNNGNISHFLMVVLTLAGATALSGGAASPSFARGCAAGAGVLAAGLLATGCSANGALAFMAFAAAGRVLRLRAGVQALLWGLAISMPVIYLAGLEGGGPDLSDLPLGSLAWFMVKFFAMPWIMVAPGLGIVASLVTLALAALALADLLFFRPADAGEAVDALGAVAVALIVFCLASAAAIAVGRVGFGAEAAFASRYGGYVAFLHVGLVLAGLRRWSSFLERPRVVRSLGSLIVIGGVVLIAEQWTIAARYLERAERIAEAGRMIRAGDWSEPVLRTVFPESDTTVPKAVLNELRARRLYMFRDVPPPGAPAAGGR